MTGRASSDSKGGNGRKTWREMLVDSLIIGAVAMAASMPSTVPTIADVWTMFKALFIAFVFQVAVERGLKRAPSPE